MKSINGKSVFDAKELGWKGSKQRCLLLTSMGATELQNWLIQIISQKTVDELKVKFTDDFDYYPKGFTDPREIELDKEEIPIDGSIDYCTKLNRWWLLRSARTPVWDLVCKAEVDGCPGLILVESKAHKNELLKEQDSTRAKKGTPNHERIKQALTLVSNAYGYDLSPNNHYQIANRIAWSLKLSSMGIPVVLVYLGCIETKEMSISKKDSLIKGLEQWNTILTDYSKEIGFKDWETKISGKNLQDENSSVAPSFVYPIIRVVNIQLQRGELDLTCIID